jgi:hypothetical protein
LLVSSEQSNYRKFFSRYWEFFELELSKQILSKVIKLNKPRIVKFIERIRLRKAVASQ